MSNHVTPVDRRQSSDVDITADLSRRARRPPAYAAENRAIARLMRLMNTSPKSIIQELADTAIELCGAGSSGISILEPEDSVFRWHATAGEFAPYVGSTMPRQFSPCGVVLERNAFVLMAEPVRRYPYLVTLEPHITEVLLVPFHRAEIPAGTLWIVSHRQGKGFDAEDLRVMTSLSHFASAAVQLIGYVNAIDHSSQALRDARKRLAAALEAGSIATWTWDIPNDRLVVDGNLARGFAAAHGDFAGGPIASYWKVVHPDDLERVSTAIEQSIRTGERYEVEYRLVQLDGSTRWVVARGKPEYDARRNPRSLSGVMLDITDQKSYEDRAQRIDERRRLALDSAQLGSWNIDPVSHELETDERFRLILSGSTDPISYEDAFVLIHDEDREQVRAAVAAAARPDDPVPYAVEYRVVRPDRQIRWVYAVGQANFTGDGKDRRLSSFDGTVADITDRKHADQARERRARQLQHLTDIANRVNSARDVNSVIAVVTEEACNLIGAHQSAASIVLDPQYRQPINVVSNSTKYAAGTTSPAMNSLAYYEAVRRGNSPVRLTQCELDRDPRWALLAKLSEPGPTANGWLAAPLVGRDGHSMGILQLADKAEGEFTDEDAAILVQLSQLTAIAIQNAGLNDELRENDERKDEFLAMLAHELRNPLAAISNAVRAEMKSGENEQADWSRDVIVRQLQHLSRLIDDLMDVSRITQGKIQLRTTVLDAALVLESAAATVKTLVEERKHAFELFVERGKLWVDADPTRLEQVVVNLLNNAAKYSDNAGHILLAGRIESGEVVISVRDQGMGIPPEKMPAMFELFTQADRSLARSEGGLGIGLTVVKKLVELHGGGIIAESEGLGKGSEFIIRLPLAKEPAIARPVRPAQDGQPVKSARVLIVDDSVDTARGMARLLKLTGYDVTTAHSGPEAIDVAKAYQPEYILLDIGLPGMTGYQVAAQLREEEHMKDAVIVAVSGYGQDEDRRRSRESGFDFHLTKPLDPNDLLSLLATGRSDRGSEPPR